MTSPRAAGLLAAVLLTLIAAAAPAAAAEGTRTDGRTGLTWVADVDFAVHLGFVPQVVTTRVQALRLITAMNRGEIENFGRRDWRIPTAREVATRFSRVAAHSGRANLTTLTANSNRWRDLVVAWPVAASATLEGVPAAAVLATNSVHMSRNTLVTGNVVANEAASGPTLKAGFELGLDRDSRVVGAVAADSLRLDAGASVTEDASYNTLSNGGTIGGPLHTPLALPVFALLPAFHTAAPRPGAPDVVVGAGQTVNLPAGDYGLLDVAASGRLVLTGGVYQVREIVLRNGTVCPACAALDFSGPADVRLVERLNAGSFSRTGPETGSDVDASEIIFYVAGINGTTGALGATPPASQVERGSTVQANVYSPNGSVRIGRDSTVVGALLGRDIGLDQGTTVTLASFFANRAPIAHPQTVNTNGAGSIVITLTGEDPENEDLTFSIVTGPTQGSLGPVVPVEPPPDPSPDPPPGPPSHTAATVTYTPATADNVEDSFVFQVQDPHGATGMATVRINPPTQEGEEPPPPTTVVVEDFSETTVQDRAVTLTLSGDAPDGVDLTFSIAAGTGPNSGSLSALVQGSESPRRSATTSYTPNSGFLGFDGFDYTACGIIESVEVCETATATIEVVTATPEPTDLAPDLEATTSETVPVEISLGSPGSTAGASSTAAKSRIVVIAQPAAFLDGAEIAGNVADANNDGFGDNHNALPGSAPVFISAAVGQVGGGAGSNGTSRIHIEWDISTFSGSFTTARVTLNTHRGTIDSLDTFFFAGNGGNGTLEDTDFESSLEAVGATMPVPPTSEMPVGADGTFTFDVLGPVNSAIAAGADFFTVQGRVDETTVGAFRGLEVRSTASGNVSSFLQPHLELTTPGVTQATTYTILTLPANGTLRNSLNEEITTVPTILPDSRVSYTPNALFVGDDSFEYEAELGAQIDSGFVLVRVRAGSCATDPLFCDPGR